MKNAPGVRVLHRVAHVNEKLHALANLKLMVRAEPSDLRAADQLHDKVGPARVCRTGVVDRGDVGMVHHRQRLTLKLEARDHSARVHSELDNLHGDFAADGMALPGAKHASKAAFADQLQKLVRANAATNSMGIDISSVAPRLGKKLTGIV